MIWALYSLNSASDTNKVKKMALFQCNIRSAVREKECSSIIRFRYRDAVRGVRDFRVQRIQTILKFFFNP